MMRRLFPSPLLSASLVAIWLLINESLSAGNWILALLLGWLLPLLFGSLRPQRPRIRRPLLLTRLIFRVGYDVLISVVEVARGVFVSGKREPNSQFGVIPLELRDPSARASLAVITTVVPGTVWCELARDSSAVMLHVWDLQDEATFIKMYKTRYESALLEIFQ